jgi:anti-sigma-K factor RskA
MSADDRDLAGEYVLGTLLHAERIAFSARLKTDPALQLLVADWEARLADLNDDYASAEAPDLLPAIEARLFPKPARRWPVWLGGLIAAAAVMIGAVYLSPILFPEAPTIIARLGEPDAALRFEARHDGDALILQRVAGAAPPSDRAHEAWLIAPGAAPVSLGLIGTEPLRVPYPDPPQGWTLAVSLEPAGGAPGGAPTGPVLAAGEINL